MRIWRNGTGVDVGIRFGIVKRWDEDCALLVFMAMALLLLLLLFLFAVCKEKKTRSHCSVGRQNRWRRRNRFSCQCSDGWWTIKTLKKGGMGRWKKIFFFSSSIFCVRKKKKERKTPTTEFFSAMIECFPSFSPGPLPVSASSFSTTSSPCGIEILRSLNSLLFSFICRSTNYDYRLFRLRCFNRQKRKKKKYWRRHAINVRLCCCSCVVWLSNKSWRETTTTTKMILIGNHYWVAYDSGNDKGATSRVVT